MVKNLFKKEEGARGEKIAQNYLKKQGYKVIDRNFRIRGGEIDIIALDPSTGSGQNATLVFIEVKTRKSSEFGTPFEAINYWKIKALIKAAQFYKIQNSNLPDAMRIDAVAVILDHQNNPVSVELVKNISDKYLP
jgi:putative endonuclease